LQVSPDHTDIYLIALVQPMPFGASRCPTDAFVAEDGRFSSVDGKGL
jgi:hypothetical protein